jgi:hypothetical protein
MKCLNDKCKRRRKCEHYIQKNDIEIVGNGMFSRDMCKENN